MTDEHDLGSVDVPSWEVYEQLYATRGEFLSDFAEIEQFIHMALTDYFVEVPPFPEGWRVGDALSETHETAFEKRRKFEMQIARSLRLEQCISILEDIIKHLGVSAHLGHLPGELRSLKQTRDQIAHSSVEYLPTETAFDPENVEPRLNLYTVRRTRRELRIQERADIETIAREIHRANAAYGALIALVTEALTTQSGEDPNAVLAKSMYLDPKQWGKYRPREHVAENATDVPDERGKPGEQRADERGDEV